MTIFSLSVTNDVLLIDANIDEEDFDIDSWLKIQHLIKV